jgi:hypothetical protein
VSSKLIIENSSGFAERLWAATLSAIAEQEKGAEFLPNLTTEVGKVLTPFYFPGGLIQAGIAALVHPRWRFYCP